MTTDIVFHFTGRYFFHIQSSVNNPFSIPYGFRCWISIRHDKAVARRRAKRDAELDATLAGDGPVASALPASAPAGQIGAGSAGSASSGSSSDASASSSGA